VVEFKQVAMRYRPGLPLVLRGVSFKAAAKEKVLNDEELNIRQQRFQTNNRGTLGICLMQNCLLLMFSSKRLYL
jgi:hypothetical protein